MPMKTAREHVPKRTRASLLAEIADLPPLGIYPNRTRGGLSRIHARSFAELALTAARPAVPWLKRICTLPDFRSRPVDGDPGWRNIRKL